MNPISGRGKDSLLRMNPLVLVLVAVLFLTACGRPEPRDSGKKVIVLGVDGMDPNFVEAHWSALPNLRRLRDRGGLTRLGTTTPPQSPVAWSTFITGMDPAQHGIFDFVHRDPATMRPLSSMAETLKPAHQLAIGPYLLPLSRARVRSFRQGRAFWDILSEHGIPVSVIRMPTNYPPVNAGRALAGMGTPDLQGTFGTYTYYTDDPLELSRAVSGGRIVPIQPAGNRVVLPVEGPENTLRRDGLGTSLPLIADIDPEQPVARFQIAGRQFILRQGEWSPWIRVRFPLISHLVSVAGMFRIYVKELHPGIRIYRSPLNVDPEDPALPISAPSGYSRELAGRIGPFYTQGIEEDTAALRQGSLTLSEYLEQSRLVATEHSALLHDCVTRFHSGLLFFYFSEIDQNSHMLWGRYESELLRTYESVDRDVGYVLDRAKGATIIVMSDHGFAPFNSGINLNTWLWREGFLALDNPANAGDVELFAHVNWRKTKVYAMGLNAVYVNLAGREKNGIVRPGVERDAVLNDLIGRLRKFRDPANGQLVVADISPVGNSASRYAPDLIVGYARGYRASWETALGSVPSDVIRQNSDAWIGDHCMAASEVPGVLLGSRRPKLANPRLKDLTVTILKEFGVAPGRAMTGSAIY
jgi:predicted AlkP superfamily phosphohydrolase/phosphomutase